MPLPDTSNLRSNVTVSGSARVGVGWSPLVSRSETVTRCTVTAWLYATAWVGTRCVVGMPFTGICATKALPDPKLVSGSMSMWSTTYPSNWSVTQRSTRLSPSPNSAPRVRARN